MDVKQLHVDDKLVEIIIRSTNAGLEMAGVKPTPVGISSLPARSQDIAVVIGLVGTRNGTVTLSISRRATLFLANQLTSSDSTDIDDEVLDAVGEITNIIAGRLKAELSSEQYQFSNISCPSIVMGGDYRVHHFSGFGTVSVEFELPGISTVFLKERVFTTTVALSQR